MFKFSLPPKGGLSHAHPHPHFLLSLPPPKARQEAEGGTPALTSSWAGLRFNSTLQKFNVAEWPLNCAEWPLNVAEWPPNLAELPLNLAQLSLCVAELPLCVAELGWNGPFCTRNSFFLVREVKSRAGMGEINLSQARCPAGERGEKVASC